MRPLSGLSSLSRHAQGVLRAFVAACFLVGQVAYASSTSAPNETELTPKLTISEATLVPSLESQGFEINGQVSVSLSAPLAQAIERGVTLSFVSEFVLARPRWWWWDEERYRRNRLATLTFHPLTRQFRVTVDGSKSQAFLDLTEALKACLAIKGWHVWSEQELPRGLIAKVRLSLDPNELPKALQVNAMTDEDWKLSSGWREVRRP
ncbi:MAG: hypothetical protein RLY67_1108 [Pseudomonadota bacterium]